jgi:hypothetical protein
VFVFKWVSTQYTKMNHSYKDTVALESYIAPENDEKKISFPNLEEFFAWFRNQQPTTHTCSKVAKYSEDEQLFLDHCEPIIGELYSDLRENYKDVGLFLKDDYTAFVQVFLDSVSLAPACDSGDDSDADNDVFKSHET